MDTYDFVHLALLAEGGEIRGKTKLQKTIYFLGVITGHLDDLGYRPHFYGPYSDEVAEAIDRMKAVGFVDQNKVTCHGLDQLGFERFRYDYRLNEVGRTVAEAKAHKYPELWERLTQGAQLLNRAGNLDYMKLSIAAKTYFLLGEKKGPATEQELAGLAALFGWSVTPEQVKEAARYLQQLGLVELITN
jgi:uncharacterized protein YwgA